MYPLTEMNIVATGMEKFLPLSALLNILGNQIIADEYPITDHQVQRFNLTRASRIPILAALHQKQNAPSLLLTDRADKALALYDELALWLPDIPRLVFPEPTVLFYEKSPWGENTRRDRLIALTTLATYHIPSAKPVVSAHPIIIASARALMTRTLSRREFLKATRLVRASQPINIEQQLHTWLMLGYQHVNTVIAPGQFARRGGILDIWPLLSSNPVRFDLFGDEIETLRFFNPATQRTLGQPATDSPNQVLIGPAREFINTPGNTTVKLEDDEDACEYHIPILHPHAGSLLDYLPKNGLVFIDDTSTIQDTVTEIEEQSLTLRKDNNIPTDFPQPYLSWNEIEDTIHSYRSNALGPSYDNENSVLADRFSPENRFAGRLKPFINHIQELVDNNEPVVIVSRQKSRLEELWQDTQNFHPNLLSIQSNELPPISFVQGSLTEGWAFRPSSGESIHLFTDGEIFGLRPPEPRQRRRVVAEDPEAAYADLQAGDFVVHVDHGIGLFVGLVNRSVEGTQREYLCVEYANEAQLFVPIHQADRLSRYIGPNHRNPSLSRLGSPEWRSVKVHVKESVQDIAEELLQLYAQRSVVPGYSYQKDTPWQQELEASFPYIETDDQIRVLQEVKFDMEQPKPMDRLICGDVGYGKTEVALRAAFKAVLDNKQVAILVPTTILAQQHYDTFRQRLSAFPVEVEMLSRFRTPQQQQQIIKLLAKGSIDIIIGTHRLLSADVQFHDLGLLIVDEEQRFGVTHKEKLKKMRTEVDVLTLTATPIPRTLYLALSGVRDISTINTPPEERLPVITHVGPFAPTIVRKAILRELERGGQVFFVHNRVHTIHAIRAHLEKLVPEARIAVAHGQMAENDLSMRMKLFTDGEIDVLLSTSIIESGLDIPNANTLIVDRADTFGLAQLYQLRGRVGRGAQRAYAYFFRHTRRQPTLEGRQRLETIAENTQLGAGYRIAMRDLEIRGTGDILGSRQSGNVAAVGLNLYTRLLAESVRKLRKDESFSLPETLESISTEGYIPISVELPLAINIPSTYVVDKNMRLRLYRRLADARSLMEFDDLQEEFHDRFGALQEPVLNLFFQLRLKILAQKAGLSSISLENGQLALKYPENSQVPEYLPPLNPLVRIGKTTLWLPISNLPDWQEVLVEVLTSLSNKVSNHIGEP